MFELNAGRIARLVGVAAVTMWAALLSVPTPSASAYPCPDVEVIFARGSGEPPGVGGVGQAFVDALRAQAGGKSLAVYPVDYAASTDFADPMGLHLVFAAGPRVAYHPETDIVERRRARSHGVSENHDEHVGRRPGGEREGSAP